MEFADLIDKYSGARIGVLGSGPTLNDYKSEINKFCDVVIACNGSLMALNPNEHKVDYFIYGDRASPKRQWFKQSNLFFNKRGEKCIRVLPTFLLPFDDLVLGDRHLRKKLEEELEKFDQENDVDDYIYFNPNLANLDLKNGVIFSYNELMSQKIVRREGPLCRGGTISGVAAQLAFKMGASSLNLFGCGFSNPNNIGNYAYDSGDEFGQTTNLQRDNMDFILRAMKRKGIDIFSFGETELRETIKV